MILFSQQVSGRGSRLVKASDRGWPCHEFESSTPKDSPYVERKDSLEIERMKESERERKRGREVSPIKWQVLMSCDSCRNKIDENRNFRQYLEFDVEEFLNGEDFDYYRNRLTVKN
ncbi:hypothetical protein TNCV_3459201 [Trichonephila clavipes]|nr:hypothetical protein TNCV_3459201 [Trichonephila clavipes]